MPTEIEVTRVDERAAQRLADATGRVTYLSEFYGIRPDEFGRRMTTDRDEAVGWGEFVSFPPQWPQPEPLVYEARAVELNEQQTDAWALGGNLGELARQTLGEQQAGDHYELPYDYANKTTTAPAGATGITLGEHPAWMMNDGTERPVEWEPEPQLRVVRVLEYRGPQAWMEQTLGQSVVNPLEPYKTAWGRDGSGEIVEQIRTRERLCRWCGGEHLGACSEEECSGNPRKGKY